MAESDRYGSDNTQYGGLIPGLIGLELIAKKMQEELQTSHKML